MNLHLCFKILRLTQKFNIYDDFGQLHYYAISEGSERTKSIYNTTGDKLATIRSRFGLQPSYYIQIGSVTHTLLTKPTFPPRFYCYLQNTNFSVIGTKVFLGKISARIPKYWLYDTQNLIMYLERNESPNINHLTDVVYDLNIIDPQHELMCICIALALGERG